MKVRVYYNLHKSCLSVQHMTKKGWRVRQHLTRIALVDVEFVVNEKGRQRVLKEKRKNVHAYVIGTMVEAPQYEDFDPSTNETWGITYNPYENSTFVIRESNIPVHRASKCWFAGRSGYIIP